MHRSTGSRLYPLKHDWLVALVEALQDKDRTSFISILSCPVLSWIHQNIQWMVVECVNKWVSFLKFIIIRNSGNFGGPCKPPLYFPQMAFCTCLWIWVLSFSWKVTHKRIKKMKPQSLCEKSVQPSHAGPSSACELLQSLRWKQMAVPHSLVENIWPTHPGPSLPNLFIMPEGKRLLVWLLRFSFSGTPSTDKVFEQHRCPCHRGRTWAPMRIHFCLDKSRLQEGLFAKFPHSSIVSSCPALSSLPVITPHLNQASVKGITAQTAFFKRGILTF